MLHGIKVGVDEIAKVSLSGRFSHPLVEELHLRQRLRWCTRPREAVPRVYYLEPSSVPASESHRLHHFNKTSIVLSPHGTLSMMATFVTFKSPVMEYVIKLQDKRVYEAVIVFLRSLGFNASEAQPEVKKAAKGAARFKGILTEDEAKRFDTHLATARQQWERGI